MGVTFLLRKKQKREVVLYCVCIFFCFFGEESNKQLSFNKWLFSYSIPMNAMHWLILIKKQEPSPFLIFFSIRYLILRIMFFEQPTLFFFLSTQPNREITYYMKRILQMLLFFFLLIKNKEMLNAGNYCILPEYHKCVLPPLTWMVGLTN